MIVYGVDPLSDGAVCCVGKKASGRFCLVAHYPTSRVVIPGGHNAWAYTGPDQHNADAVYLENAAVYGRQTGRKAAQSIGISWAYLYRDLVQAFKIPIQVVDVHSWQKLLLPGAGDTKQRAAKTFRALFGVEPPRTGSKKRDTGIVDAALIAAWGYNQDEHPEEGR